MSPDASPISVDLAREADFQIGDFRICPSIRQVVVNGESETLEPRIMQVLVCLARRAGEVVSRDELIQACWGGRVVGEDAIHRTISKVRRLAEASGAFAVETIPRVGYRLTAAETVRPAATSTEGSKGVPPAAVPAGQAADQSAASTTPPARPWWRSSVALFSVGLACVLLIGIVGYWAVRESRVVVVPGPGRVVVLPFDAQPAEDQIAHATSAAIADYVHRIGFDAISPSQARTYVGDRKPLAGKELGADYVIDGEATARDDQLRLSVRLTDAGGVTIWSHEFSRSTSDGDALATEAGMLTADVMHWMRYFPEADANNQAINLRSIEAMLASDQITGYEASRSLVERNPGNSFALINEIMIGTFSLPDWPVEQRAALVAQLRSLLARESAMKPRHEDTHLAESALTPEVDWARREQLLRQGVIEADGANTLAVLGYTLEGAGRVEEGEALLRQGIAKDPVGLDKLPGIPQMLFLRGQFALARQEINRLYAIFPARFGSQRFLIALHSGDFATVDAMLRDQVARDWIEPPAPVRLASLLANALRTHRATDVDALVAACRDASRLSSVGFHMCFTGLGATDRLDQAFTLADAIFPGLRGATEVERERLWLTHPNARGATPWLFEPELAAVRADKRVIDVFSRVGLLDYWRSTGKWPDFCKTEPQSVCAKMKSN